MTQGKGNSDVTKNPIKYSKFSKEFVLIFNF